MSKHVFLYLCTASSQDGSLEQQEKECRAYCEQHDLVVTDVFRDMGCGLDWQNRNAFPRMRKKYLNGEVSGVVVLNPGSISRNLEHLLLLTQEMAEHHITVYYVEERFNPSPLAFLTNINGEEGDSVSSQEARMISKLVVNVPEAGFVLSIFETYHHYTFDK